MNIQANIFPMLKTMAEVLVTLNKNSTLNCDIDLSSDEWNSLNENNLTSFKMEEHRRPCEVYKNGIFPGASPYSTSKQITRICRFTNYLEFSKVMLDDTEKIGDDLYLTTRFYERREIGWKSPVPMIKEGELVGYYLNGDIYHKNDKDKVYHTIYSLVYAALVLNTPAFIRLQNILREGICLKLKGANKEFLQQLGKILKDKTNTV